MLEPYKIRVAKLFWQVEWRQGFYLNYLYLILIMIGTFYSRSVLFLPFLCLVYFSRLTYPVWPSDFGTLFPQTFGKTHLKLIYWIRKLFCLVEAQFCFHIVALFFRFHSYMYLWLGLNCFLLLYFVIGDFLYFKVLSDRFSKLIQSIIAFAVLTFFGGLLSMLVLMNEETNNLDTFFFLLTWMILLTLQFFFTYKRIVKPTFEHSIVL